MSAKDEKEAIKISVVMHEYDTLRSEILLKYNTTTQMVAQTCVVFAGFVAALIVFQQANTISVRALVILLVALVLLAAIFIIGSISWLNYDTRRLSKRLREIESCVNARLGERLLRWEIDYGWEGLS